jgi:hypothetical protein
MADSATPKSGKFGWSPIRSPKQAESEDGIPEPTGKTLPSSASRPKK